LRELIVPNNQLAVNICKTLLGITSCRC